MPTSFKSFSRTTTAILLALVATAPLASAKKVKPEQLLYSFTGGSSGGEPSSGLVADSSGNFYGTTFSGGGTTCNCGVVFKLAPGGAETVLHAFQGGSTDGSAPTDGVVFDADGNAYGTTQFGGVGCTSGCGTVYKIAPGGTETILYFFQGGDDGKLPAAGVILDGEGNLYGVAEGGANNDGVVYEVAPDGTQTVLYTFSGPDGMYPAGHLAMDASGDLYGATNYGGTNAGCQNCGVVFELAPDGTETVLHSFGGAADGDGYRPDSAPVLDSSGNLYGATPGGGNAGCGGGGGCGTVYEIAANGTESVLYEFLSGSDGADPLGAPLVDPSGNIFGMTLDGGANECPHVLFCGTIYEVAAGGGESVLFNFKKGKTTGYSPEFGLIEDQSGNLYGTTYSGGLKNGKNFQGVVFKFTP